MIIIHRFLSDRLKPIAGIHSLTLPACLRPTP